ncbi:MAG: glucosaminidase domain-containing protein [Sulfurospirillum sp.]|nr:glucosaminidase domain-containing protein [Sulfurospirillum sp.]MBL0702702.1 glucosaminidase domain-containing protein [Sulfurospirillum sp.]
MKQIYKILTLLTCTTIFLYSTGFPPSYYKLNGKTQKKEFINILKPLINESNKKTTQEREFIEIFFTQAINSSFRDLKSSDLKTLLKISKKYRVKNLFDRDLYLKRIDEVPVNLALSQGAIESAWGKSRFVREANNIFGHWTWGKIGLIPTGREEGKTHRIRIFNTLQDSVDAYVLNLNRHYAYKEFREFRQKKRENRQVITSLEAADTMINYSEQREKYVNMLHNVIKDNYLLY